jgi:hypothetical protein
LNWLVVITVSQGSGPIATDVFQPYGINGNTSTPPILSTSASPTEPVVFFDRFPAAIERAYAAPRTRARAYLKQVPS